MKTITRNAARKIKEVMDNADKIIVHTGFEGKEVKPADLWGVRQEGSVYRWAEKNLAQGASLYEIGDGWYGLDVHANLWFKIHRKA